MLVDIKLLSFLNICFIFSVLYQGISLQVYCNYDLINTYFLILLSFPYLESNDGLIYSSLSLHIYTQKYYYTKFSPHI